jgi:hypothetical protein
MFNLDYLIHPFKEQIIENFFDGELGNKGPDGHIGETGEVGYRGLKGKVGLDGLKGAKGIPGEIGLPGDKGDPGDQGKPGSKGIKGEKGVKGPKGDTGYKGDLGERGDPGKRGIKGIKGEKGPEGALGDSGKQFSVYGLPNIDNKCNWRKVNQRSANYLLGTCEDDEVIRGIKSTYWKTDLEQYRVEWKRKWVRKGCCWADYVKRPEEHTTKEEDQHNRDYEICCSKLPIANKKIEFVELNETYDLSYPKKSDKEYYFYN